jgi:hypothetical protein
VAAVSGQGTTYNLPNYHGELFTVTPTETPLLAAIGGLAGAGITKSTEFEWQTIDRRASVTNNAVVEGAAAPAGAERSRANITNVVEVHHSAIEVSYTKLAASGNYSGANIAPQSDDAVLNELALQTMAELQSMAVDIELSCLTGTKVKPANNATARATQGVLGIAGTISANGGTPRAISKAIFDSHLLAMYTAGAPLNQDNTVVLVGGGQKLALTSAYAGGVTNQVPMQRTIGGVAIDTLVTDFGTVGVMLDRWMPAGQIAVVDLTDLQIVFLEIPEKGLLFVEELARTGAARKFQLYGEVGLKYGPANAHGVIKDLS